MATITDPGWPTLQNVAKRLRPDGSLETDMAEILNKKLAILEDMPWKEGNLPTGHRVTARNGLPSPTWRFLNDGVPSTKSDTVQYDETCGILEDYSTVDCDVAKLNGNEAAFRASEDKAKLEAFGQELSRAIFYESITTSPEKLHGLSPRYFATTGGTASAYVLGKGTRSGTNCRSIWLIDWSEDGIFGIFPKGSVAGLQKKDLGEQTVKGPNGGDLQAYRTHFQWKPGLCVKDYRKAVRMQWDPDDATLFGDGSKGMYLALQEMLDTIHDMGPNARFYMDRVSRAKLNAQLASNDANFLSYIELGKRRVPAFLGVPIRVEDTLVAESAIS